MEKVYEILSLTRRSGSTTWILKAAIRNPECIIVCRSIEHAWFFKKQYVELLDKQPFYLRIWWWFFGRKFPEFVPFNIFTKISFRKKMPVIFDNQVFINEEYYDFIEKQTLKK